MPPAATVRPATPDDVETIIAMIEELAVYEKLRGECVADASQLREHLFGETPSAEVLLADFEQAPVGFALFFHTYSTFLTKPGIWLEDLYVEPEHRGSGVGFSLLSRIARIAADRDCGRLEWTVLDWNNPAIDFYRRLGAKFMDDWTTCRLDQAAMATVAAPGGPR